ncbi:MAG: hypothetical protein SCM11_09030 [Bacillota bacterium]|nr:hypothetical protein [Bacillota bacterium]
MSNQDKQSGNITGVYKQLVWRQLYNQTSQNNRQDCFAKISQGGQDSGLFAENTQHIGHSGIATTLPADIFLE